VNETCRSLRPEGVEWSVLPVDRRGVADPVDLARLLSGKPACLVSVMHANNETGVLQPVEELARVAHGAGALFHTDAVQSAGKVPIREVVAASDLVSLASHKLGGPAGIGALVVKGGARILPAITGGAQEGRRRAGTEPVPLAVAFAEALAVAEESGTAEAARHASLRDFIEEAVASIAPGTVVHGRGAPRLPNTSNLFIPGAAGRTLVMQLDLMGYAISTGSACSTGSSRPSHVLTAMGCTAEEAIDSVRISLGQSVSRSDIAGFLSALSGAIERAAGEPVTAVSEVSI
jgi:cysteine desulfurase